MEKQLKRKYTRVFPLPLIPATLLLLPSPAPASPPPDLPCPLLLLEEEEEDQEEEIDFEELERIIEEGEPFLEPPGGEGPPPSPPPFIETPSGEPYEPSPSESPLERIYERAPPPSESPAGGGEGEMEGDERGVVRERLREYSKKEEEIIESLPEREQQYEINFRGRYLFVPGFLTSQWFTAYTSIYGWSSGVEYLRKKYEFNFMVSADFTSLSASPGNWLYEKDSLQETKYVESRFYFVSVDLSFLYEGNFSPSFSFVIGAGLGAGYLFGNLTTTPTTGDAKTPPEQRAKDFTKSPKEEDYPEILPVFNFPISFRILPFRPVTLRLDFGFRNSFLAGLSFGTRF